MSRRVAVVGSLNQDLTIRVPHLPAPGETVLGTDHVIGAGGKGANQAAAAGRLGADVAMIGRVGDDAAGRFLLAALADDGVEVSSVVVDPDVGTGLAFITLDDEAENAIVVSPGANGRLSADDVHAAAAHLADAAVTLIQLEVPLEAVAAATAAAGGSVVLNPAPARPLPRPVLDRVDILVPNRTELGILTGRPEASSIGEAAEQARGLASGATVVVTLGAQGALIVGGGDSVHVPAPHVDPVDTTAAGDAFCGALAASLARGEPIERSVRWAVHAGAVAATRRGALASLPNAADVRSLMNGVPS
jgi:ribokinase